MFPGDLHGLYIITCLMHDLLCSYIYVYCIFAVIHVILYSSYNYGDYIVIDIVEFVVVTVIFVAVCIFLMV